MKILSILTFLAAISFLSFSSTAIAEEKAEKKEKTMKFYHELSEKELKARMRYFNKSLGVKCSFCHIKDKSVSLNDSITDPKSRKALAHKEMARDMIQMVQEMNEKYLGWKHGSGRKADQIDCMFCHRNHKDRLLKPSMLFDVEKYTPKKKRKKR